VSLCYDYRSGLKDRSKEVKQLTDEITSLRDVLESILKLVEEDGTEHTHLSTLKLLTKSDGILLSCKEEMTLLEKELQPVTGFRAAVRTLKWPYARADFEKKVNRLGQLKSSLTLALAADHTYEGALGF
jgi:hypothetical protein